VVCSDKQLRRYRLDGTRVGSPLALEVKDTDTAISVAGMGGAMFVCFMRIFRLYLAKLDPSSGRSVSPLCPVARSPLLNFEAEVGAAEGALWFAASHIGVVTRVDASTNRLVGAPIPVLRKPQRVGGGFGSVWVASSGVVTRIDPLRNAQVAAPIAVGGDRLDLVAGEDVLWVSNRSDSTVVRIDPEANEVVGEPIGVGREPGDIAYGGGYVWVHNDGDNTVTVIDPGTGRAVGDPVSTSSPPGILRYAGDALWVMSQSAPTITRIAARR
jgi:YVTN family beta-propeller protein